MSLRNDTHEGFGYPLHTDEHRGSPVELDGVPQIPSAAHEWMKWECGDGLGGRYASGHSRMPAELERQTDERIAAATAELRRRRLAKLGQAESCGTEKGDNGADDTD